MKLVITDKYSDILDLIGYEALSLTVAMVIVGEWQIVSDDKFHEMPPGLLRVQVLIHWATTAS